MITEQDHIDALAGLRADPKPINLELPKLDAWILLSVIRLALRHPEFNGNSSLVARRVADELEGMLATNDALKHLAAIARTLAPHRHVSGDVEPPRPTLWDLEHIGEFVGGEHHHLTAHLMRLVKKADAENRARLAAVYPYHVAALEAWEQGAAPRVGGTQ